MALCFFISSSAYYANKLGWSNFCNFKNFSLQILIFLFLKKR